MAPNMNWDSLIQSPEPQAQQSSSKAAMEEYLRQFILIVEKTEAENNALKEENAKLINKELVTSQALQEMEERLIKERQENETMLSERQKVWKEEMDQMEKKWEEALLQTIEHDSQKINKLLEDKERNLAAQQKITHMEKVITDMAKKMKTKEEEGLQMEKTLHFFQSKLQEERRYKEQANATLQERICSEAERTKRLLSEREETWREKMNVMEALMKQTLEQTVEEQRVV